MNPSLRWGLVIFSLILTQAGFAGYSIVLKAFAQNLNTDPLVFSSLRDVMAFPLLLFWAVFTEGHHTPNNCSQWILFLLLGLFGMLGNQLGFIFGLYYTSPSLAAIVQPLIPVVTYFISVAIGMEAYPNISNSTGLARLLGIVLSVLGAMVIIVTHRIVSDDDSTKDNANMSFGLCCLFVNVISMSLYVILRRLLVTEGRSANSSDSLEGTEWTRDQDFANTMPVRMNRSMDGIALSMGDLSQMIPSGLTGNVSPNSEYVNQNMRAQNIRPFFFAKWVSSMRKTCTVYSNYPVTIVAWSYLFGGLFMTLCCGMYIPLGMIDKFQLAEDTWIPLLYAVSITSTLCYALISWTQKYLQPSLVVIAWPLQVPFVVILSFLFFGDQLAAMDYVGATLIVSGLIAVTWADNKSPRSITR
eukprot:CFRG3142T1